MNTQQLNALCTERINRLAPYIRTIPDEDMRQEAMIGIYEGLKCEPHANDTYLKQKAKWNIGNFLKKGRSVDNGAWKRDKIRILHYDIPTADGIFSVIFKNRMEIPVDELVNDKIGMDRFYLHLTREEKDFIDSKLEGWSNKRIMKELRISVSSLKKMKDDIKFKIELAFT